jgi:hypothetical protein
MMDNVVAFTNELDKKGESVLLNAKYFGLTVNNVISAFENAGLEVPVRIVENTWIPRKGLLSRDFGWGNGYVKIISGHPYYMLPYDEIGVNVHGGLTFGELIEPNDKFLPEGYWVGFDTSHYSDTLSKWSRNVVYQETLFLFSQIYGLEY